MSIFRRRNRDETSEVDDATREADAGAEASTSDDLDTPDASDTPDSSGVSEGTDGSASPAASKASAPSGPPDRSAGPFDVTEVEDEIERLDLGSLLVAPAQGTELRLEIEQESQSLVSVMAVMGSSQVQLSAFAAPRTSGIWEDIRDEITESVLSTGGTAQTQDGPFGTELLARIPSQGADGRTVFAPARFVGIDGPRWFLRAVLYGPAALAEQAANPLLDFVRGVVVVRGDSAMAPREMLPLRLPADAQQQAGAGDDGGEEPAAGRSRDDLKPFERGPEITEVR